MSHGVTCQNIEDDAFQMEGPTKEVGQEWVKFGQNACTHKVHTQKGQGRAAVLTTALMAGKCLEQTAACIGSDYGKVNLE